MYLYNYIEVELYSDTSIAPLLHYQRILIAISKNPTEFLNFLEKKLSIIQVNLKLGK